MNRIVHFEIPVNNPDKVIEFYKSVFGWNVRQWGLDEYWLASTGDKTEPGIDGAFFKPKSAMHGDGYVNTIQVENIDESIEKIKSAGGQIVIDKRAIRGLGYQAYGKDVEGTLFGLIQEDVNAK